MYLFSATAFAVWFTEFNRFCFFAFFVSFVPLVVDISCPST